jgi:hypothetical protein
MIKFHVAIDTIHGRHTLIIFVIINLDQHRPANSE